MRVPQPQHARLAQRASELRHLLLRVAGRDDHPQAGRPLGHGGRADGGHEETGPLQPRRRLERRRLAPHLDRHDRAAPAARLARRAADGRLEGAYARPELRAPLRRGEGEGGVRRRHRRQRQCGGVDACSAAREEELMQRRGARDKAAVRSKRLRESADRDVDAVGDPGLLGDSSAALAVHESGVRLVEDEQRAVPVAQRRQPRGVGRVAVHREDRV
mmetsp:Transcript_37741/g.126268  ORF Transcript_37741/g.126268 Transcript_37741/m.126268 type:complete len:217 (-) Transcript_37741:777-1427(-)